MRRVLGYVRLNSFPPLRYESVQTAFVSKTHAVVEGRQSCLENCREREIVVV